MTEVESQPNARGNTPQGADNESKPCVVCKLEIPTSAQKCTHCGSYQRCPWRYLGVSETILALVVALVSVLGWAVPAIYDFFKERNSDLSAGFVGSRFYWDSRYLNCELRVLINNSGDRPGVLDKEAKLKIKPRGSFEQKTFKMSTQRPTTMIDAHSSVSVIFSGRMYGVSSKGSFSKATLSLSLVNFDSSEQTLFLKIPGQDWPSPTAMSRKDGGGAVPVPDWLRVDERLIFRNEPIARGGGKPHMCEELVRQGGELVYVSPQHPQGLTEAQHRRLISRNPKLRNLQWVVQRRNPLVFVRGKVRPCRSQDDCVEWLAPSADEHRDTVGGYAARGVY